MIFYTTDYFPTGTEISGGLPDRGIAGSFGASKQLPALRERCIGQAEYASDPSIKSPSRVLKGDDSL
jgi:hypothetical protein